VRSEITRLLAAHTGAVLVTANALRLLRRGVAPEASRARWKEAVDAMVAGKLTHGH